MKLVFGNDIERTWSTCGKILLRNSNYANINWNGFCVVLASLTFICLASLRVKSVATL
jgi:hypothetical protein